MTLEQRVQHLELELRKARPSASSDAPALMKRISALESEIARLKSSTPTKPAVYTPAPAPVVAKPADMGLSIRLTNAEREIERLKVKESAGAWLDWTPTVSAHDTMTYGTITINVARYSTVGRICYFYIDATGTTGGTATPYLTASMPKVFASGYARMAGTCVDGGSRIIAYARPLGAAGSTLLIARYDMANWGLGASRAFSISGFYEY